MIAEPLLNAVLHLSALQVSGMQVPDFNTARRQMLAYLNHHVGLINAETYIGLFDELVEVHAGKTDALILEHATGIAIHLKPLLHGHERYAAVFHFLELAALGRGAALPRRIALLLGNELGVAAGSMEAIFAFISDPLAYAQLGSGCLMLGGGADDAFRGRVAALHLEDEDLTLIAPAGGDAIYLEGRALTGTDCRLLGAGQVLRDRWGNEMHLAHIAAAFRGGAEVGPPVFLCGKHLEYRFPGSGNGLHDFSFSERNGRLVAIMGGSGSGKSTLLRILNGTIPPNSGELLLNGRNVYAEPEAAEGVFGFIPQDDLLFEDLTVFQNLLYAARLCMAHLPEEELVRRVRALLADLGQGDAAALKVGSPLQKTISGGQRKRLNIALELIREPTVLFVDEPTSGLSSADSEMVMSLLKEQALRGKLVLVVIHQPSSKILRMFDALWVLDQGGWPIFCGTPLEAVAYFRSRGGVPGAEETICPGCGGVNPEQIFAIIEEKLLDQGGRLTQKRRVEPQTWCRMYRDYEALRKTLPDCEERLPSPGKCLNRPGRFGQLRIFFARDLRARLANKSYLTITLLEPPLLGLVLGLVSRGAFGGIYSFHENKNILSFFFMSVIVALFLGLSVSAEEICRDAKIQQRERFLHLSWWSYINSKSLYLTMAAGLQMLLYLGVAMPMVEVPGLFLKSWAILFACALASSLLGLNISASLRSAVTIYILIPLLLVPQMLLSGVIIPYDDLIAVNSSRREVPVYTNLLPSRWGYEALVVEQYCHNAYMRPLLEAEARVRLAEDDLDFYLPELQSRLQALMALRNEDTPAPQIQPGLIIFKRELKRLEQRSGLRMGLGPDDLQAGTFTEAAFNRLDQYFAEVRREIFAQRAAASTERREIESRMEQTLGREGLESLRNTHTNLTIQRQVLNLHELKPIGAAPDGLFHRTLLIFRTPESPWGTAHFLARHKRLGTYLLPTYPFNLTMIFLLAFLLYLALGFRLLPRICTRVGLAARRALI